MIQKSLVSKRFYNAGRLRIDSAELASLIMQTLTNTNLNPQTTATWQRNRTSKSFTLFGPILWPIMNEDSYIYFSEMKSLFFLFIENLDFVVKTWSYWEILKE